MKAELPADVVLKGDDELLKFLEGVRSNLRASRLQEFWNDMLDLVLMTVREHAPHWHGDLQADLDKELYVDDPLITGVVFSDDEYAPWQERGTDPYFPNVQALTPWAEDHDISPWYVAQKIATRGIIPLKFFEKGFTENQEKIVELVDDVIVSVLEGEATASGLGGTAVNAF
jgi:hypothetical protein